MIPGLTGKVVAVVGRAASLIGSGSGAAIDACDVVVRVNWMLPLEGPAVDVGTRTDVVYFCAGCLGQRTAAQSRGVCAVAVDKKLRKRIAQTSGFDYRLFRPTTGVVAIYDAVQAGARMVRTFGFDLYRSGYATPAPPWMGKSVKKWQHSKEQDLVLLRRLRTTPRVTLDPVLLRSIA
jgi:hypothetical protein